MKENPVVFDVKNQKGYAQAIEILLISNYAMKPRHPKRRLLANQVKLDQNYMRCIPMTHPIRRRIHQARQNTPGPVIHVKILLRASRTHHGRPLDVESISSPRHLHQLFNKRHVTFSPSLFSSQKKVPCEAILTSSFRFYEQNRQAQLYGWRFLLLHWLRSDLGQIPKPYFLKQTCGMFKP